MSNSRGSLRPLFAPESIAIIGASQDQRKAPMRILDNLRRFGYPGRVYPVNPKYEEVAGWRCYRSLEDLPEVPDLAVLAVASHRTLSTLELCAQLGVRSAVSYTAGFSEAGEQGRNDQQAITDLARKSGMRILGPNCQGAFQVDSGACTSWSAAFSGMPVTAPGSVAWISQSGAVGTAAVDLLRGAGLNLTHWISTGNEADVDLADAMEYALNDERTQVICGYLEAIRNTPRFREVAALAARLGKPIILAKGGMTPVGATAAASHTGSLAGSGLPYEGFFKQCRVLLVTDLADLVMAASLATNYSRFGGQGRVGIMANSGGLGILLADSCSRSGLQVPPLVPAAASATAALLPDFVRPGNPVDMPVVAMRRPADVPRILEHLAEHQGFDAFLVCLLGVKPEAGYDLPQVFESLHEASRTTGVPVLPVFLAGAPNIVEQARSAGLAAYSDPGRVISGLGALTRLGRLTNPIYDAADSATDSLPHVVPVPEQSAERECRRWYSERTAKDLLRSLGLPVVRGRLAINPADAALAASQISLPAVVKACSADLQHKSEVGGVRLNLTDHDSIRQAFDDIVDSVTTRAPHVTLEGCLVEEMIDAEYEVIIGTSIDSSLGPLIMFGLGGVYVEFARDVAFRVLPISELDAREMIQETLAGEVLRGVRGKPAGDVKALISLMLQISDLTLQNEDLRMEIELNPVAVQRQGQGVQILDAVISETHQPVTQESPRVEAPRLSG